MLPKRGPPGLPNACQHVAKPRVSDGDAPACQAATPPRQPRRDRRSETVALPNRLPDACRARAGVYSPTEMGNKQGGNPAAAGWMKRVAVADALGIKVS